MSLATTRPCIGTSTYGWSQLSAPCGTVLPRCAQNGPKRRCMITCSAAVVVADPPRQNGNGVGIIIAEPASTPAYAMPAPLPAPEPLPGVLSPAKAYAAALALGTTKAAMPWQKIFTMGVLAGGYLAFGGLLAMCVGGACPGLVASNPGLQKLLFGAFGLPFGLTLVLVCGGELFTGNTALVGCALLEGRATKRQVAKSWAMSYAGNFLGALAVVAMVAASGLLAPEAAAAKAAKIRGVMCNWLVCLSIWQATASTTFTGKFLGAFLPVSAFVAMGMEHSIANMAMIPYGIAAGAPVTFSRFMTANLLPVTLGNIIGGFMCVALPYAYIFGGLKKEAAQ